MKLLLYCNKSKPYLLKDVENNKIFIGEHNYAFVDKHNSDTDFGMNLEYEHQCKSLNGKIVAECDFEVEKIIDKKITKNEYSFGTQTIKINELLKGSCLTLYELCQYIGTKTNWDEGDYGYANHIKNLHMFDKPQWLMDCFVKKRTNKVEDDDIVLKGVLFTPVRKAPKNMMRVVDRFGNKCILISITPESLCKILNGEQTIIVKNKVLKEMIK